MPRSIFLSVLTAWVLSGASGTDAWAQAPGIGRASLDTITVMVGGGVRGRIDTLEVG